MAYLSSSTLAARLFASVTHFTFLIKKKDGKATSVFKQWQTEVCGTSPCHQERGGDEKC